MNSQSSREGALESAPNAEGLSKADSKQTSSSISEADAPVYEAQYVHAIYEQIAPHFSATRYKPWPAVSRFLSSRPPGSIGLDIGCGNGKYFGVNPNVYLIGSDHSAELTAIARVRATPQSEPNVAGRSDSAAGSSALCADACVADGLSLPHPRDRLDFVISVAVVHHFATRERRVEAVAAFLDAVRPEKTAEHAKNQAADEAANMAAKIEGGRVLICVWALEQRSSRRGWDRGMEQDVLVPWVMKSARKPNDGLPSEQTFQRYYHLYREGELEEDVETAGGLVLENGYEADNWWVIAARPSHGHT